MNKATLSAEELVGRWEERREIKNLMGRYAVSFLLKREKTMFSDFWSERAGYGSPATQRGLLPHLGDEHH